MDRATAKTRLANMVAATSRPVLADIDLENLLNLHQRIDTAQRRPADVGWVPTWDLIAAASEGWGWKAGKVAGDFNFSADGASYTKADVMAHCVEREAHYAARTHGTSSIAPNGNNTYYADNLLP